MHNLKLLSFALCALVGTRALDDKWKGWLYYGPLGEHDDKNGKFLCGPEWDSSKEHEVNLQSTGCQKNLYSAGDEWYTSIWVPNEPTYVDQDKTYTKDEPKKRCAYLSRDKNCGSGCYDEALNLNLFNESAGCYPFPEGMNSVLFDGRECDGSLLC